MQAADSTDDSENDGVASSVHVNAFGEVKTSRYRRPPRDKKVLDEREKIPTRRSTRIKDMIQSKNEMEKVC
ncbi:MAG: hypothetical protein MJE68_28925 [Proteobacteria bacterium]|nr:hypothetical protein [Pseudomonadota bacterium]